MRVQLSMICLLSVVFTGAAQYAPGEIEIIRDKWGVPHIYAPTDPQVSYGLAWAHAEDDFKTIQEIMLASKQMLGAYLGKKGAPVDYVVGLLQCDRIVAKHLPDVDPAFMRIVSGYTAGLNAYAQAHRKEVLVKDAFPITITDVFKAYVLQLAVQDGADKLIKNLFEGNVDEYPMNDKGSNAFVMNRSKSSNGNVMLAINSHQPLEGPAAWYEAHLVSDEGWNMMGGLFPGGPVIFHGTNEHLGWAHTVNYFDKIDVFQLQINPDNENQYWVEDRWLPLQKRKITLRVKAFLGLKFKVKRDAYASIYGPVVKNEKGFFAFHMAVFDEIRAVEQWYKMNKARNFGEFKASLNMNAIPSFNIVYGDKYNNIFYVGNGKIPFRNKTYDWSGTLPGNRIETIPQQYHKFSDLPKIENPSSGYLFNTNNTAFNATAPQDNLSAADFDPTMGYRTFENNRSTRFMELMEAYEKVSYDDFLKIKYDGKLPDSLLYKIDLNPLFTLSSGQSGRSSQVLQILQNWNKETTTEEVGPAHLFLVYEELKVISAKKTTKEFTKADYIAAAAATYDYLIQHFGKVNVTLGEYQKLQRGGKSLPLGGLPDVITAMYSEPAENGRVKGRAGESYIMMVQYPETGLPIIETVNVYGASNNPASPHYDDQMDMFVNKQRKTMTLDIDEVRKNAKSIYHPE